MDTIKPSEHFGSIEELGNRLTELLGKGQFVLVTDESVELHCYPLLAAHCPTLNGADVVTFPPGEESKAWEIAAGICQSLMDLEFGRHSTLVNLGGGVTSDLGGFVASIYKRGIRYINIPTSLMAMTDAAIGGKTALNIEHTKNVIGTFHQPTAVLCYDGFLRTLPPQEMLSGFAEMLKHGLIADGALWHVLMSFPNPLVENISPYIIRSARIKESIVNEDPFESGKRKLLNFGHTIGHAVEGLQLSQNTPISHGHAIAIGMCVEAWLSAEYSGLSSSDFMKIKNGIMKHFPIPVFSPDDITSLLGFIKNDKKNTGDQMNFTLLANIGSGVIDIELPTHQVQKALEQFNV